MPKFFYHIGIALKKPLPDSKNLLQNIPEEKEVRNLKCTTNVHY